MLRVRGHSITEKLTRMNMLVSGAALSLACAAFVAYDIVAFRQDIVHNLSIQAQIAGSNSVSALLFNDSHDAEKTLSALKAAPNILSAHIYTSKGQPFASYWRGRSGQAPIPPSIPAGQTGAHWFKDGQIGLVRSIVFQGKPAGSVYIQSDLREINDRLKRYAGIAAIVLLTSLLAALLVSSIFQRAVAEPITHLAGIAAVVSRDKDYSVRATPTTSRDELASLIETFNEMLAQIQERDGALQKAHNELEERVRKRTAELAVANKELEAFSYSVSHDLRAPLRSIDGFTLALSEDYAEKLDDRAKNYISRARAATQRMGILIDSLLTLARMSRTEMCSERVDLTAIARSIGAELHSTEPQRQVELVVHDGINVPGDSQLLRIVVDNLLNNAWKYTSKHPRARIEFGKAHADGNAVYFMKDDGAGFDPVYSQRLFGAFQRLHGEKEFQGTGVGLATVQRIIHRHGGRVWAEGAVEKGATFYFTL
jgi:signal transduction histidine kinase